MYSISFHPEAEKELLKSVKWYQDRSELGYNNFKKEFADTISLIKSNPLMFTVCFANKHRANLSKFPFSLIYTIEKNEVVIYSVFHNARNSDIWKKR